MIDTQRYTVRLYTSSGGTKMIRRHNGAIERQYRLNIGKLPVAYRCEPCGCSCETRGCPPLADLLVMGLFWRES